MIDLLLNVSLFALAATSHRNNKRRKLQCEHLEEQLGETQAQLVERQHLEEQLSETRAQLVERQHLEEQLGEKQEQLRVLTQQLDDMSAEVKHILLQKEEEWNRRIAMVQKEALKLGQVLCGTPHEVEDEGSDVSSLDLNAKVETWRDREDTCDAIAQQVADGRRRQIGAVKS